MMKKILSNFSLGVKQSLLTITGHGLSTGISAISLLILTRILGPEKFGIFSVGVAIMLIISKLNDAGINIAANKYASRTKEPKNRLGYYTVAIRYKLKLSIFLLALGLLSSANLASYLQLSNPNIIYLAIFFSLATTWYEHIIIMLQSMHLFAQAVFANLIQSSTKLIGALTLLFLGLKSELIAFALYAFAPFVVIGVSKKLFPASFRINIRDKYQNAQLRINNTIKHTSIAVLTTGLIENVDTLFIKKYLSTYETGLFSGIVRIALLLEIVGGALAGVLNSRVARYKNIKDLRIYSKKALGVIILSIAIFALIIPFSEIIIKYTIGQEYLGGANVLIILIGSAVLRIATAPIAAFFFSFDANWYFSVTGIISLAIAIIGNTLFLNTYGINAAAWTRVVIRASVFILTSISAMIIIKNKRTNLSS